MFRDLDIVVLTKAVEDEGVTAESGTLGTVVDTWSGGAQVEVVEPDGRVWFVDAADDALALAP